MSEAASDQATVLYDVDDQGVLVLTLTGRSGATCGPSRWRTTSTPVWTGRRVTHESG